MANADPMVADFATASDLIRGHARQRPHHPAMIEGGARLDYAELDRTIDRVAAALQRDGVRQGDVVSVCAGTSLAYGAAIFGILRAGAVVAPLAPSSPPDTLVAQLHDCAAKVLFLDENVAAWMGEALGRMGAPRVALDGSGVGRAFAAWLAAPGEPPTAVPVSPDQAFNIIYSSGTTGAPKGIVHTHGLRRAQERRGFYGEDSVTIISTPLYSNTTLVSFLPTITRGGTAVLLPKFDVGAFLEASEAHRVTHAMLVPVQYRRLLEHPDFDAFDLSSYRTKFCTSAPFAAELKAEVLRRWPGDLLEIYGMTEGGGACILSARKHPDKLHTVGQPMSGHDIRLIDEDGREVAHGEVGEVVGRSRVMMQGYHNQPERSEAAYWRSPEGLRFIRTGDLGRFDDDCFLSIVDRKKDMIISGGFNVYPSDIETQILVHEAVREAAVVGAPSRRWGETPVAFVVLTSGQAITADALRAWVNQRLGKTQRLSDLRIVEHLPRSQIGKVLKRELRDSYAPAAAA